MDEASKRSRTLHLELQGGVIHGVVQPVVQELADAQENVENGKALAGGGRLPVLLDGRKAAGVSREARLPGLAAWARVRVLARGSIMP